jgi:hypothetical protein
MRRRIILHAGFHKTGTKTLQETLSINTALLMPHVELYLQNGALISSLAHAVLEFSGNRCKQTKADITACAQDFFALLDPNDPRPVFVSSESLAGHFPGASGVSKYAPAPIAMALIRDAWTAMSGSPAGFETYYSTRRTGWLASCHWQRLKSNRSTLSLEDYTEKFAGAADHGAIITELCARLGPDAVHTTALEDMAHPIDPVLALLGLTHLRDTLTFPPNANTSLGEEARDKLLTLNRSAIWGAEFERAKAVILRKHS